jgi:hypothetical protein
MNEILLETAEVARLDVSSLMRWVLVPCLGQYSNPYNANYKIIKNTVFKIFSELEL